MRELDRVVDRVKPWFMVHGLAHGSWFMNLGSVHGFVHGFVHVWFMVWFMVHGSWFIMLFLNMVDYPAFFPSRSTLTLDTIATFSGT